MFETSRGIPGKKCFKKLSVINVVSCGIDVFSAMQTNHLYKIFWGSLNFFEKEKCGIVKIAEKSSEYIGALSSVAVPACTHCTLRNLRNRAIILILAEE